MNYKKLFRVITFQKVKNRIYFLSVTNLGQLTGPSAALCDSLLHVLGSV